MKIAPRHKWELLGMNMWEKMKNKRCYDTKMKIRLWREKLLTRDNQK